MLFVLSLSFARKRPGRLPGRAALVGDGAEQVNLELRATHGQPSLSQGFLPCRQTAIRLFLP
jgi:hypothetical protein